jgi:hypothetical protein
MESSLPLQLLNQTLTQNIDLKNTEQLLSLTDEQRRILLDNCPDKFGEYDACVRLIELYFSCGVKLNNFNIVKNTDKIAYKDIEKFIELVFLSNNAGTPIYDLLLIFISSYKQNKKIDFKVLFKDFCDWQETYKKQREEIEKVDHFHVNLTVTGDTYRVHGVVNMENHSNCDTETFVQDWFDKFIPYHPENGDYVLKLRRVDKKMILDEILLNDEPLTMVNKGFFIQNWHVINNKNIEFLKDNTYYDVHVTHEHGLYKITKILNSSENHYLPTHNHETFIFHALRDLHNNVKFPVPPPGDYEICLERKYGNYYENKITYNKKNDFTNQKNIIINTIFQNYKQESILCKKKHQRHDDDFFI